MPRSFPHDSLLANLGEGYISEWLDFQELSGVPATPPANVGRLYTRDNVGTTDLYFLDPAGVEYLISGAAPAPVDATYLVMSANATLTQEVVVGAAGPTNLADDITFQWNKAGTGAFVVTNVGAGGASIQADDFFRIGTTGYATQGGLRLPNNSMIGWRQSGGAADWVAGLDSSDRFQVQSSNGLFVNGSPLVSSLYSFNPSLIIGGYVTGGAPAQHDVYIQTGNNANPQVLATRAVFPSNVALAAGVIALSESVSVLSGSTPATIGAIRLPNASRITGRNSLNNDNIPMMQVSALNVVDIDPDGYGIDLSVGGGTIRLNAGGGDTIWTGILRQSGTPATVGNMRWNNNNFIAWRDAANTANFTLGLNASNNLAITAPVTLSNKIWPGTDAAAAQVVCGLYAGTGAPNNANGVNGDIYFRSDGGALTTVYQRRAGVWVGVV